MPRPAPALADEVESTADSLAVLAKYRRKGIRNSFEVVKRGERVLSEKGALKRMGDEVWPFLEQLGFAALDTGKNDLASICIQRLEEKFPSSPRVDALYGLLLEVENTEKARLFYEKKLGEEENSVLVRKRLIALHLHSGSVDLPSANLSIHKGIELLVDHLDVVYSDVEAWSELANAYERLGMLQQSISCISDLILLEPTNTFHVLRHAETSYTLGEYAVAYRGFCRALEMAGPMKEGGLGRRAGLGIKLCLQRMGGPIVVGNRSTSGSAATSTSTSKNQLVRSSDADSEKEVDSPRRAKEIDALVTEELLFAYTLSWNAVGDRVAGHEENKTMKVWLERQNNRVITAATVK